MKEYCTLVTADIANPFQGEIKYSVRGNYLNTRGELSQLQGLMSEGWEVVMFNSHVAKLSTDTQPILFAFTLEREKKGST